ncbi:MAG TPA: hypothetical protein VGF89_07400 [Steroidobacteraceae bacterium]|jgi:hypothetical protein
MPHDFPALDAWNNFYVIVGSSAAGLTGLTFVVIALASEAKMVRMSGLRTFITPIVLHFGSALWLAALASIPGHNVISIAVCMGLTGLVLSAYAANTTWRMYRGRREYRPVVEDWIWNAFLPLGTYLLLLIAGVIVVWHALLSLYLIGAVALALLFIGIHNAWDLAVWITAERPGIRSQAHPKQSAADKSAASEKRA